MAKFVGDGRDAKRARKGAQEQERMKEAFDEKVAQLRGATDQALKHMRIDQMFATEEHMRGSKASVFGLQSYSAYKQKMERTRGSAARKGVSGRRRDGELATTKSQTLKTMKKKKRAFTELLSFGDDIDTDESSSDNDTPHVAAEVSTDKSHSIAVATTGGSTVDKSVIAKSHELTKDKCDASKVTENTSVLKASDSTSECHQSQSDSSTQSLEVAEISSAKVGSVGDIDSGEFQHSSEPKRKRRKVEMRKAPRKNPAVDTSFLNDAERDSRDEALRQKLLQEWEKKQAAMRKEQLQVVYSYWDGSGHRRTVTVQKGTEMGEFLEVVRREQLQHEFTELRGLSGANLLYIKDDTIVPHHLCFYDLIATEAQGATEVMFPKVEVGEYGIQTDGGFPGKVVTRSWYDRNKHIYPASNWKVYTPKQ